MSQAIGNRSARRPASAAVASASASPAPSASTPATSTPASPAPAIVCAHTVVVDVEHLGTHFVRLTLAGEDLRLWASGLTTPGPVADAFVKLIVPPAGLGADDLAPIDPADLRGWFALPAGERGWMRTYTVRRVRTARVDGCETPAVDVDVVTHPDDEGPGSDWARRTRVGDAIRVLGPGRGQDPWSGFDPGAARRVLCAGDASAAPAMCSIAELLDPRRLDAADVLVQVADAGDRDALAADVGVRVGPAVVPDFVIGCDRRDDERTGGALVRRFAEVLGVSGDAVDEVLAGKRPTERQWQLADDVRDDAPYVVLAGEAGMVQAMRRLCVDAAGIPKGNIAFMGYWRRGARESE